MCYFGGIYYSPDNYIESMQKRRLYYFISDVHLGLKAFNPVARERNFARFLNELPSDTAEIYLLGDIFDFWYEYKYVIPNGFAIADDFIISKGNIVPAAFHVDCAFFLRKCFTGAVLYLIAEIGQNRRIGFKLIAHCIQQRFGFGVFLLRKC